MSKNISEQFIALIMKKSEELQVENLLDEVKLCLLDYLGCSLAGAKMIEEKSKLVLSIMGGDGEVPVIGQKQNASPTSAALVNAMQAHVTELDDGHRYAMLHPGTPVISAMISAAANGLVLDGKEFAKGIVLGYEVTCRLAQAIQPGHKLKGFHATGTCGTIGAALGVALAKGCTKEQLCQVLSAAVASASGVLEMIDAPSQLKPFTVGQAAMNGYVSACLGISGFIGPKDPLGGKRGFFKTIADDVSTELLLEDSAIYKICQRYTKAYAACRHCHSAIEATLDLNNKYSIDMDKIQKIMVYTYKLAIFGHDQTEVHSVNAAKMSTPFSVATALINDKADFLSFTEKCISDMKIHELMRKVYVLEDEELTAASPGKRGARVEIYIENGDIISQQVDYPLGEPENPMSKEMIEEKFLSLGVYAGKKEGYLYSMIEATQKIESDLDTWLNLL